MRQFVMVLSLLILLAVLTGCGAPAAETSAEKIVGETETPIAAPTDDTAPLSAEEPDLPTEEPETGGVTAAELSAEEILAAFPSEYAEIIKRNDLVLATLDGVLNAQLWENFWNDVTNGTPAVVVTAMFTVEGDPILYRIEYDGDSFTWCEDSSRDKFGAAPWVRSGTAQHLLRLEDNGVLRFVLSNIFFEDFDAYRNWYLEDGGEPRDYPVEVLVIPVND